MPILIDRRAPEGNAFCVIGTVMRFLKEAGLPEQADEAHNAMLAAGSYDDLCILAERHTHGAVRVPKRVRLVEDDSPEDADDDE